MIDLSIVVPLYNEEQSVRPMYDAIAAAVDVLKQEVEIVFVDDGRETKVFQLNRSYYGLYVPNLMWRSLENFSTNSLGMILASRHYEEEDYLRDYENYLQAKA